MGKIKKILENELIGGTQSTDVYPVTSTQAVYDENNRRLSDFVFDKNNVINDLTTGGADKALSAEMGRNLSFPDWLDLSNSELADNNIPFLSNAGNINIAGFDKSVKLGFSSFVKGHSTYGNRIRLAWFVNNEWVYGGFALDVDFREFRYVINGKEYSISMDVDSVPDSDTVYVSQPSGIPRVQMNDKYSVFPIYNNIKSEVKIESDRALLAETVLRYRDLNIEYTGNDTTSALQNVLKYLRIETDNPNITSVQFRIISLVKNHETYAYRFGLGSSLSGVSLWISTSDNIFDGKVHSKQFNVTVDGSKYTYKVYFQLHSPAAISDGVIISHTYDLSPYIVMTEAIDYIGDLAAQIAETQNLKLAVGSIEEKVSAIEDKINEIGGTTSFDKSSLLKGQCYYYLNLDEALNNTTAYSWYSNIFQVVEGQFVHIITDGNANAIPAVILYDTEGNLITSKWSNTYGELDVIDDFEIPKGVTYMAVNCHIAHIDSFELTIKAKNDAILVDNYKMPIEQRNVVWIGSSNVWGDGFLDYSYLKAPLEWLYKSTGTFTSAEDATAENGVVVTNDNKLLGNAVRIAGEGSTIAFKHRGSELNICQVIERSSEYAVIGLYDGDTKVAEFTNHNKTIGSDNASFTGNGSQTKFNLDRCFTYNHRLTVNSVEKSIVLNTQGYGASFPDGVDCLVIRAVDAENAKVVHSLWFKNAPANGAVINVEYDYGETICFVKSTVGEDSDGVNESPYGDGTISYDPNNPATIGAGLDYRLVNEKAFFKYWFDDYAERNITLKIERGSANPYFIFNFASSVYHNVMNAGIGGYTAAKFNTTTNNPLTSWVNIADYFTPDFVSIGLTGNDDWQNFPRKINRVVNMTLEELREYPSLEIGKIEYRSADDTYDVTLNSGTITEITSRSLKSPSIIGSKVAVSDFVRIGTYTGDLRQVQTRRVESVDIVNGIVTWAEPLHLNEFICLDSLQDLVGQDVSIRSIEQYMTNMKQLIENILSINPKCRVCLFNVYYVDMWVRDTAEYTYIQQWIASEFPANVFVVDAWKYSRDYVECSKKSRIINVTADGGNEIAFASPSTLGHWEGIEVWVGDRNVYGTDCYVVTGYKYTVDPNKSGTALNWEGTSAYLRPYSEQDEMQIKWKKNVPASGTAVTIKLAYRQWSTDWAHPGNGDYVDNSLGRAMIYALNK